jgi:hypothetical protein
MSDEMEDELLEFFKEEEGNEQQKRKREQEKEKRGAVPLKKRSRQVNPTIEETPKEDSVGSDESSGNELYWDKEDKKLLLALPEAKRERIL